MPRMSSIAGTSIRAFGFAWGALTSIFDNWVSGTPRSLGTSTSGQAWTVVQGAWTASGGGTAATSTAPSSYPFAVVPLNQNVQASIQNAQPGSGLVFWETDAGDWWASIINATTATVATGSYCISNSCCTGSPTGGCNANSCCTGSNTCVSDLHCSFTCPSGCLPVPMGGPYTNCYNYGTSSYCGITWIGSSCCTGSNTCVSNSCCTTYSTCVSNTCCSTGTTYTTYYYWGLAIIKSVASVISTVASITLNTVTTTAALIQSLSLTVIGGNVAVQAYSDTALTTSDGSPLATTGTPGGTNVGIIVAPTQQGAAAGGSAYTQGNSAGIFSAH
jgi:hypothetical protein